MTMRRALGDVLLSACALSLLVAILMAFDGRVREQVRLRIDRPARASSDIVAVGTQLRDLGDVLFESAKMQSQQHGSLMVLVASGVVLTIFMLRT
jgi:hypothetical protein